MKKKSKLQPAEEPKLNEYTFSDVQILLGDLITAGAPKVNAIPIPCNDIFL